MNNSSLNTCIVGDIYSFCNEYPRLYKQYNINAVLWVINSLDDKNSVDQKEILAHFPQCDIVRRLYPDVSIDPLFENYSYSYDNTLIKFLNSYFTEILEINDRTMLFSREGFFYYSSAQKIQIIHVLALKIKSYLVAKKVDFLYFSMEPHSLFEFLLYLVAKYLKIQVVLQRYTGSKTRSFYSASVYEYTNFLSDGVLVGDYTDKNAAKLEFNALMKRVTDKKEPDDFLEYQKNGKMTGLYAKNIYNVIKDIRSLFLFNFKIHNFSNVEKIKYLLSNLTFYCQVIFSKYCYLRLLNQISTYELQHDQVGRYVYLALPWQPEMTTLPNASDYRNLVIVAKMLRTAFPENIPILVKEHPAQNAEPYVFLNRFPRFYQEIQKLKNVHFVKQSLSTFILQKNALVVASVNGTVGFEAAIQGKIVFIFGSSWYEKLKGVYRIKDQEECSYYADSVMRGECEVCSDDDVSNYFDYFSQFTARSNTIHAINDRSSIDTPSYFKTLDEIFRGLR